MKINSFLEKSAQKTCVALGFFDGVHLGHQVVIKKTVETALTTNTIPTVFTFAQNPKIWTQNSSIKSILTVNQKETLLRNLGITLLYRVNFLEIMNLSPSEFVQKILSDTLQASYVFCGFNFRFGKNAAANSEKLAEICQKYNIKTFVVPPVKINKDIVSSTQIRKMLACENLEKVTEMLGRNFF